MSIPNTPTSSHPSPPSLQPLLKTVAAAVVRDVEPSTLEQWRWNGRGPKYCKIGRNVRYRPEDLQSFIESTCISSTNDVVPDQALGVREMAPQKPGTMANLDSKKKDHLKFD